MIRKFYHGTNNKSADSILNNGIDINKGRNDADFGLGFYMTEDFRQAQSWAKKLFGDDAADAGSWGTYVAYRQLAPFASFAATYDHKDGFEGCKTLKGWEIGADYTFAKNIIATAKYFNGKDTALTTKDKVTGVWTRVDFLF